MKLSLSLLLLSAGVASAGPGLARPATISRATNGLGLRSVRPRSRDMLDKIARKSAEADATPVAPSEEPEAPKRRPYSFPRGTAPMGDYFDPLGLTKGKSESELKRFREAEITHSRVAMLAALGFIFQEALIERPLFATKELGPIKGPAIYHFQEVAERFPFFWLLTIPAIGYFENIRARKGWQDPTQGGDLFGLKEDYTPGDLGFDPFGAFPIDSNGQAEMRNKELNNGRLAMLGVAGLAAQELVNGKTVFDFLQLDKIVPPHGPY